MEEMAEESEKIMGTEIEKRKHSTCARCIHWSSFAEEHADGKVHNAQITVWSRNTQYWGLCLNSNLCAARKRSDKIPDEYDDFQEVGIPDIHWVITGAYFGCTEFHPKNE